MSKKSEELKMSIVAEYNWPKFADEQTNYFSKYPEEYQDVCWYGRPIVPRRIAEIKDDIWNINPGYWDEIHFDRFQEDMREEFDRWIGKEVHIQGSLLGWRGLDGKKKFILEDAQDIWRAITPEIDFTLEIKRGRGRQSYRARCCHHDSPTGELFKITFREKKDEN